MITILITICIALIIIIIMCIKEEVGIIETIFTAFFGTVFSSLLGILFALMVGIFLPNKTKITKYEILAIKDGNSTNGSFFLGCGTIKNKNYYYYYRKNNNGFSQDKVLSDNVIIYEDATDSTSYIKLQQKILETPYDNWGILDDKVEKNPIEFHVPKGTIIKQFKLDLEN